MRHEAVPPLSFRKDPAVHLSNLNPSKTALVVCGRSDRGERDRGAMALAT